tara:strand:+ start:6061 stop:6174 length:114 start_codon:yes stop_codon:yes gene_type:complete
MKNIIIKMIVKKLIKLYPNDMDLGKAIRKLILKDTIK